MYLKLTDNRVALIQPIIDQLATLCAGQGITISDESEQRIETIRQLLYSYFFRHNLKSTYKIKRLTPQSIFIQHRAEAGAPLKMELPKLDQLEQLVCEALANNLTVDEFSNSLADQPESLKTLALKLFLTKQ